ncbi:MAG: hypothetical protein QOH22_679, partial [Gemmatimonadaceae bacterium]|nr:hypothetical protein [Gemmatimonadaceae bacterium]
APLTHSASLHSGSAKFRNMARVIRSKSLRNQRLDPFPDDFVRLVAEDGFSARVEERDTLKRIHADHCIGRDSYDFRQDVVRYPIGHGCPVIPYKMESFPFEKILEPTTERRLEEP